MKKFMYSALLASAFLITACGSDDDGGAQFSGCVVCTTTIATVESTEEFCDNEDGTVVKNSGEIDEIEIDLEGVSFSAFIQGRLDAFGGTCTQQ